MSLVVARRSSRLTERIAQVETDHQNAERQYTLNLTKALKKKAEQCTYEAKICEVEKGSNRVFQMSAGIYELYKLSLISHFEAEIKKDDPAQIIHIKSAKDKQGKLVETQIRVTLHKASKGIGPLKYTVNLYHTRSSMMVNGRDAEAFTRAHKVALGQILNIQNLDSIDDELHSILVRELDNIGVGSLSTNLKAKSVKDKEQAVKILQLNGKTTDHLSDCTPDMPPQFLCLHCGQSAHTNVIECSACTEWFHFDCEGMSLAEFQAYDDAESDYICNICKMEHQNQTATEDIEVSTDRQLEETGTGDVVPLNGLGPTDIDKSTPIQQPDPVVPISTASTGERTSNATTEVSVLLRYLQITRIKNRQKPWQLLGNKTRVRHLQTSHSLLSHSLVSARIIQTPWRKMVRMCWLNKW